MVRGVALPGKRLFGGAGTTQAGGARTMLCEEASACLYM